MKKILTFLIIIVSLSIFGLVVARSFFYAPTDEVSLPAGLKESSLRQKKADPVSPEYPNRLMIPSISLDARFQYVGVTRKGNMSTPNNFSDVGWYRYGPLPGDKGSAVVAGHVDDGLALPAVFWNLDKLKMGDDIYVKKNNGATIHFVVTNISTYNYNAPTAGIFSGGDKPLLKLITCAGTFIPAIGTHDKRLVVTAEMVSN